MNLTTNKNWKTVKLEDLAVFSNGKTSPARVDSGEYPVFGANGIIGFSDQKNKKENSIVIGRVGSYCGSLHFSEKESWVTDNAIVCNVRENSDPTFIFYLLSTLNLNSRATGSGQPLINQATLNTIEIFVPESIDEQKEIAGVLGCLDDKIELLRKENKTLEEMAQALFKRWFVDFKFPNATGKMIDSELGEIPEGWRVGKLSEIADFLNGLASQNFPPENKDDSLPVIKIREMKSGITTDSDKASRSVDSKYIVKSGDLLFSWSGSLDVVLWSHVDGVLNQHLFKVTSENYPKWFYYYWVLHHLPEFRAIAESKATTMGHIQRHHLDDAEVLIPNEAILGGMDNQMSPLLSKQILNNSEIQTLSKLRDDLLNKIFSN